MSKQRVVKDEMWDDDWFFDLKPDEKLVWIYLLTNPHGNIAGIYKLPSLRLASSQLGLSKGKLEKILSSFVSSHKILWENGYIGLINFHKHLVYSNPNTMKGIQRLHEAMKAYTYPLKGFERLWVTLLNLTLLYLSDSEDKSSRSKKKL